MLEMGLVAPWLRIEAWNGVRDLDEMAHLMCLRYCGLPIGAYEGG